MERALKYCLKYDREKLRSLQSIECIFLPERSHGVTKSQTQVSIHVHKGNIINILQNIVREAHLLFSFIQYYMI